VEIFVCAAQGEGGSTPLSSPWCLLTSYKVFCFPIVRFMDVLSPNLYGYGVIVLSGF